VHGAKAEIRTATAGCSCQDRSSVIEAVIATPTRFHQPRRTCWSTYLGGDGIFRSGVSLLILTLLSLLLLCAAGLFDATDASVDKAGS